MHYKKSVGQYVFDVINIIFMLFIVTITLYPFWYIFIASFSDPFQVAKTRGIMLWFKGFDLTSYISVFRHKLIWSSYKNTLFYVLAGTTINLIVTVLAAYALSRRHLIGRGVIMKILVFTMFFSGGLIPTYLIVDRVGLIDTRWALIIPNAISTYNLIILRTALQGIPEAIEDAAIIDGASQLQIMVKIIIPLSVAPIMVIALYYAVGHWNSFFSALVYIRDSKKYPLQLILRDILINNSTDDMMGEEAFNVQHVGITIKYATIIVSTLPILCVYPFIQKYFIKGVMIGSLKG